MTLLQAAVAKGLDPDPLHNLHGMLRDRLAPDDFAAAEALLFAALTVTPKREPGWHLAPAHRRTLRLRT
ncbi:MAG: hypothetical protein M0Z28_29040 [Rhodospirillales bacterium]|nr:hypothetical protein [Rhodospirillales bacterium]